MIDRSLVVGNIVFETHHDRAVYISMSAAERRHWLETNRDRWQTTNDSIKPLSAPPAAGGNISCSDAANGSPSSPHPIRDGQQNRDSRGNATSRRDRLSAVARDYQAAGWVSLCLKDKQPVGKAWQKRTLTDQIPKFDEDSNIGILLGEPSGGLVRLDYDLPRVPGVQDELFPATPGFGRTSAPAGGLLLICKGLKTTNFLLPKSMKDDPRLPAHGDNERNLVVLQILSTGAQTMAPPSVHPTTMEEVQWESVPNEIAELAPTELLHRAGIEATLMVVRHFWPARGVRNEAAMALARVLLEALELRVPEEVQRIELVDRLVTIVAMAGGDGEGSRHGKQRAAGTLEKMKAGEETIGLTRLVELLELPKDAIKCLRKWLGVRAEADDSRIQIIFDTVDDLRVLKETQGALLVGEAPIFQRGGQLAHVFRLDQEEKVADKNGKTTWSRPAGSLVIKPVGVDRLRLYLSKYIRFVVPSEDKEGNYVLVPIRAPKSVAADFIAMSDAWRLRVLRGIAETPTMREDGSLLTQEGYDEQSRTVLDTNGAQFDPIPQNPTREDAERALAEINKLLHGFPFDGNKDGSVKCPSRSVALSLILTGPIVGALAHIPMHLGDAAAPGTGKGLLGDVASIIATGRIASRMTQGRDEAEDEKRLVGAVLQGTPMLMIDNVEQALGGDFLCTIITDGKVQVRVLGQTGQHEVDVRTLIYATGNNVKVRGDMVRRAVKCRMDAAMERPEDRRFDVDPKAYALKARHKLVSAVLTILRAFAVAPDRQQVLDKLPPYNGFEQWSERVRASLMWLGEADPCETRDAITDEDPVTNSLVALVAAWVADLKTAKVAEEKDDGWYTTSEICVAANEADPQDRGMPMRPALHSALEGILPRDVTSEGLGRFLSRYVDRVIGGYRLRKRKHPITRVKQYLMEPMDKADQAAPARLFDFEEEEAGA